MYWSSPNQLLRGAIYIAPAPINSKSILLIFSKRFWALAPGPGVQKKCRGRVPTTGPRYKHFFGPQGPGSRAQNLFEKIDSIDLELIEA